MSAKHEAATNKFDDMEPIEEFADSQLREVLREALEYEFEGMTESYRDVAAEAADLYSAEDLAKMAGLSGLSEYDNETDTEYIDEDKVDLHEVERMLGGEAERIGRDLARKLEDALNDFLCELS